MKSACSSLTHYLTNKVPLMLWAFSWLEDLTGPSPEVLAFAQPLAPVEVLAAPGPVAALLSFATVASPERQAVAEAALGEAPAVAPFEVVAAAESLVAFAVTDSPGAASLAVEVAALAAPAVAAVVPSPAARAE